MQAIAFLWYELEAAKRNVKEFFANLGNLAKQIYRPWLRRNGEKSKASPKEKWI
jgi:hypothetical protein